MSDDWRLELNKLRRNVYSPLLGNGIHYRPHSDLAFQYRSSPKFPLHFLQCGGCATRSATPPDHGLQSLLHLGMVFSSKECQS